MTTCDPYVSCELEDHEGATQTGLGGSHRSFRPRNAEVAAVSAGARTVSRVAPYGEVGPRTRTSGTARNAVVGRKQQTGTTKIAVRSTDFGVVQLFNPNENWYVTRQDLKKEYATRCLPSNVSPTYEIDGLQQ